MANQSAKDSLLEAAEFLDLVGGRDTTHHANKLRRIANRQRRFHCVETEEGGAGHFDYFSPEEVAARFKGNQFFLPVDVETLRAAEIGDEIELDGNTVCFVVSCDPPKTVTGENSKGLNAYYEANPIYAPPGWKSKKAKVKGKRSNA